MEPFQTFTGVPAYLDRPNIDTDLIIPKQFLKFIKRNGFGQYLFNDLRFQEDGQENPAFILNQETFRKSQILFSRENFGCGSSREHAAWALMDFGFKVIVASSFGDIFRNNSLKNGLLLIELPNDTITAYIEKISKNPSYTITVDLENQTLTGSDSSSVHFEIDSYRKEKLLLGLDEIGLTLSQASVEIAAYEKSHNHPWEAVLPDRKLGLS
ncbi:MAG: 3-isopropylmalate dehydratase small subunit [Deltaproteobacteria bacterium]|jgi:3-isopropylmalate/(R)-2-methylmalate dehydratase small subunit|nr:3-isopropylmalate dehydratase small subunit [Deltaproteobacteria bacterium]